MVEPVTKQFADKVTGTPIVGGDFQLRDILGIAPSVAMTECTDPLYPGRYTADEDLRPGIWAVQRRTTGDYEDTGEHVTVGPGWTFAGEISEDSDVVPVELILGSVVNATAFVPLLTGGAPTSAPTIAHLQAAVNYAADAGIKRVYVGSYKGINDWQGASALDLTAPALAGIILDLGGARLKRTTSGGPVINMLWGFICNGTVEGEGSDAVPEIVGDNDGYTPVCCYHINFPRLATAADGAVTIRMAGGGYCPARFIQCVGHRLYKQALGVSSTTRVQTSDTQCLEVSTAGGLEAYLPPEQANVQGEHISMFFAESMTSGDVSPFPPESAPFSTSQRIARALKHLWFTQNPLNESLRSKALCEDRVDIPATLNAKFNTYGWSGEYSDNPVAIAEDSFTQQSSGSNSDIVEGITVKKRYRFAGEKYLDISLDIYARWANLTGSLPVGYAQWRPREIFFPLTTQMQESLRDINGSDSVVPGLVDWGRPISGSGFFQQGTASGDPQNGICNLSGFSLSIVNSVLRITVSPAHADSSSITSQGEWLRSHRINTNGPVVMKLHLEWNNPNNTSIPGIL
jgi:hypothetical protein